jgi:O-Antigen ligase
MTSQPMRSFGQTPRALFGYGDTNPRRLWVAMAFVILVAITGGGSRSDIASIATLRALSVLFAAYALWAMPPGALRALRWPLFLLVLLASWMVIQLIPLPMGWWSVLPGRDVVHQIDMVLGQAGLARPISLTPSLTVNSLLSLVVPFAAILLFATLDRNDLRRLCFVFIGVAVASALMGMLQVWLTGQNALYLYRITNQGSMVGLFSNRNHHAISLACSLVLVALAQRQALLDRARQPLRQIALLSAALLIVVVTIAIGSRGGLVTGLVGLAVYAALVWPLFFQQTDTLQPASQARQGQRRIAKTSNASSARFRRIAVIVLPSIALAMLVLLFVVSEQSNAIQRSLTESYAEDLRGQTLPVVLDLIRSHWLTGTGYGSFAAVYASVEPGELLQPEYFNHAHNDWAQLVIEGGLPMVLIVLAAVLWIVTGLGKAIIGGLRQQDRDRFALGLGLAGITLILAASSIGDYPLRTPSIMILAALVVVTLSRANQFLGEQSGAQELV